jgi:cysteine desulfuration protein SufE
VSVPPHEQQTGDLPDAFAEIAEDFRAATTRQRLDLLLEFSDELPVLPERLIGDRDSMEQVDECQSPVFLTVEVDGGSDAPVHLYFDAPDEAPTTRGFAGILHAGLNGLPGTTVLAVPDDAPMRLGLAEAVSPLRLRGMVGMLSRIKRQVRLKTEAASAS